MLAYFKKLFARADVNKNGKVDKSDVKEAVHVAVCGTKAEAKVAAEKVKATAKKAAVKAKTVRAKKTT